MKWNYKIDNDTQILYFLNQSYEEEQKQLQASISDLTEKLAKQQEDNLNLRFKV